MTIGTSNTVGTAIHFLYGKNPKISTDNAEGLLEVAEFLMIEALKAKCINFLKNVRVNADNCLKLLLLCSRYDLYLEGVSDFILSHIPDLFSKEELMLLDKESVHFIITDQMLSYVNPEDCFKFLVKWCGHNTNRRPHFAELLCLDKDDVSADVLSTISLDCLNENDKKLCRTLSPGSESLCDVLIAYPAKYAAGNYFLHAYKFNSKCWFQLLVRSYNCWPNTRRISVRNENTVVSLKSHSGKIAFYDILKRNELEKKIEIGDEERGENLDETAASDSTICCIRNFTCYTESKVEEVPISVLYPWTRRGYYELNRQLKGPNFRRKKQSKHVCSLYIAEVENEDQVIMKPVISVYGTVASLTVMNNVVCLLIPEKEQLMLYEEGQRRIKKLDLSVYELDDQSYVCPRYYGGIYVVTKSHILQIDLHFGTTGITANVSEFLIQKQEEVDDRLSRIYPSKCEVLRDKIITIVNKQSNNKSNVSFQNLPEEVSFLDKEERFEIELPERLSDSCDLCFLQTRLPKDMLRCSIGCPHCNYRDTTRTRYLSYERDSEPEEYIDSEDYGMNMYYYDSSDCYYDSSDY